MTNQYTRAMDKIRAADGLLIGASNGLSISEGVHIFAENEDFIRNFGDFREKYGFRSLIQGCFYPFPTEEEKWAFFSRLYKYFSYEEEVSTVMKDLLELVRDKNHFVVTSNIDDHFRQAGFAPAQLFEIEGNARNLQCRNKCHDHIQPGDEVLSEMAKRQENGKILSGLIPECSRCGGPMQVHIEVDRNFLRGEDWQKKRQAYQNFIEEMKGKKLVLLELGVGAGNQLIKAPFMQMTHGEENFTYITLNKGELYIPDEIASKSIGFDGDTAEVLHQLVRLK